MKLSKKEIVKARKVIEKYYAQRPSCCDRMLNLDEFSTKQGGYFDVRDEFTRDKDRIIYSKAFRRLQHKAQVYSHEKSDHYRTRLTHTLEVNQISRGIARNLGLNENLVEAIALGHDIGHTPFGHAGEEVLDEIMRGENFLDKFQYHVNYGGFKHNFNSVKILDLVEEKYDDEEGLNLTWQVLDGIVKHTSIIKNYDYGTKLWDWKRFVKQNNFFKDLIGYNYPTGESIVDYYELGVPLTLEGQVVKIADEIAQREHDLDDSYGNNNFNNKDIFNYLNSILLSLNKEINENMMGYNLFHELNNILDELCRDINSDKKNFHVTWENCVGNIISYFIRDVTENSMEKLMDVNKKEAIYKIKYPKFKNKNNTIFANDEYIRKYIIKDIISFSEVGKLFNDKIEMLIENKIINSYEVNRFDGKAKFILRQLFKAYYENPKQMPQSQLLLLEKIIIENSNKYGKLEICGKNIIEIKFVPQKIDSPINLNDVDVLIKSLKLETEEFNKLIGYYNKNEDNLNQELDRINNLSYEEIMNNNSSIEYDIKHYLENNYAYLYVICNYISKMTDNYAEKEYQKLYLGSN